MKNPYHKNLKALIDKVLADERWDLKFIGMQIIIEGLALAAFGAQIRTTRDPLLKQVLELVMRGRPSRGVRRQLSRGLDQGAAEE